MKNSKYINIQEFMFRDLKLSGNELIIYALIHGFSQDGKSFYYGGADYITELLGISEKTVYSILNKMTAKGLLFKKKVKNFVKYEPNGNLKEIKMQGFLTLTLYATTDSRNTNIPTSVNSSYIEEQNSTSVETSYAKSEDSSTSVNSSYAASVNSSYAASVNSSVNNKFKNKFNNQSSSANEEEDFIVLKIKTLFGGFYPFYGDLAETLHEYQNKYKLTADDLEQYVEFIMRKVDANKQTVSKTNYFYKIAMKKETLEGYLYEMNTAKSITQNPAKICPVCNCMTHSHVVCPNCTFDLSECNDLASVNIAKQIWALPKEVKSEFNKKMDMLESDFFSHTMQERMSKQKEFDNSITELYESFGIKRYVS